MGSHVKQYLWGLSKLTWGLVNRRSRWYGSLPSLQSCQRSLQEPDWLAFIDLCLCPVFTASPDRPNSLVAVLVSNVIIGLLALSSISPSSPAFLFAFTLSFGCKNCLLYLKIFCFCVFPCRQAVHGTWSAVPRSAEPDPWPEPRQPDLQHDLQPQRQLPGTVWHKHWVKATSAELHMSGLYCPQGLEEITFYYIYSKSTSADQV